MSTFICVANFSTTQEKISLNEGKLTNDTCGKAGDLEEQEYIVRNHFRPNNDKKVKTRRFGNFSKFYAVFDFFHFPALFVISISL